MPEISRRAVLRSGAALSVASLAAITPMTRTEALFGYYRDTASDEALAALAPRERRLMDFGWKFLQGNAANPAKDLGFGGDQGAFSKSGSFDFAKVEIGDKHEKYDDSKWRSLDLPHDWAVELPFVHDDTLQSHGYKPLGRNYPETSVGWYRKTFDLPKEDAGRRITIDFDGAFRSALIFLNGYFIGRNDNGYAPFSFDVSNYLVYGAANALVVRMDASFGDGWFYEGAGIYRHVWLTKTDPIHLGQWESYVRADVKGRIATLSFGTAVLNHGQASAEASVHWKVLDATGKTVATAEAAPQSIAKDGQGTFTASARLAEPALWSPEAPTLYTAIITVQSAGKATDAEQVNFGVRTILFDADKGFFLNGKSTKIKGTCNHQDHAGVGTALPDRLQWYRLAVLKEMGSNAVRTSHNMPTPEWVEACDRMGMMMMCETRNEASTLEGLDQISVMIKRYRNSPSIILWSIGNEESELQKGETGVRVGRSMVDRAHEHDPTRLCTAAVNNGFGTGISKALDVMGFNYGLPSIDSYHQSHPHQPLLGSETASTIATRGVYETDKLRNTLSAYDLNLPSWAETAETWWKFYAERDYLAGGFAWTGFDYRGEPVPYGWPSISSQYGILDTCGHPKDNFFYYKAWWGTEPVLHLFPHWNWEERFGQPVDVWVHSNLDEVELFLNGKSLGSQKVTPRRHLAWNVKYEPGIIEARGSKAGKVVLTEKRETTGKLAAIRLTPDRTSINANGEDLAILRVEGIDDQGRVVPTADTMIQFKVTGNGALIGVGNGDPNCLESDKEPKRSLFNGLAQAIVQANKTPGEMAIEAWSEDWPGPKLPPITTIIKTLAANVRPGI